MDKNKKTFVLLSLILVVCISIGAYSLSSSKATTETGMILEMNENEIKINKVILLNSFIEEDKRKIEELGILPSEYPGGFYRKDLNEIEHYKTSSELKVSIVDTEQKYSTKDDRKHTFESYNAFLSACKEDLSLKQRHYIFTIKKGAVVNMEEKFYN
ncbi:MAG: hypothetical protein Q4D65_04895 [Peptostreptococcaceae bacterium]|nr:hypothetical protein [Peptostreptococcaceae bacterium]